MMRQESAPGSFGPWFAQQFLATDDDRFDDLRPIGDKEFYGALGILFAGVAAIALTIGPLALR
jgi:hypothetical protein